MEKPLFRSSTAIKKKKGTSQSLVLQSANYYLNLTPGIVGTFHVFSGLAVEDTTLWVFIGTEDLLFLFLRALTVKNSALSPLPLPPPPPRASGSEI